MKTQPYICRVHIENFRNFHSVDFRLSDKQVLIGENAVGKSNFLVALQLILDPTLTEKDRMLEESDFWEGLQDPIGTSQQILIELFFTNFEDNQNVLAQLQDATVMLDGKETLKLTYRYFMKDEDKPDYSYVIFKGNDETRSFTYEDRKILNIRVIKAIRDVESEMRNSRTSPLTQIIKQKYTISKDVLAEISRELEVKGADTLHIDQVGDLENRIRILMNAMVSFSADEFGVSLKTMNIDATKLLYALRPLINNREAGNTKGIIFVEGIAEEYLVASFANLLRLELDRIGLVICDINSTDFEPYCRFVEALGIPNVVITDGDYYHVVDGKKSFGNLASAADQDSGFAGIDRASHMHGDLVNLFYGDDFSKLDPVRQREVFARLNTFIGDYTFEIDIFNAANTTDKTIL